MSGDGQASDEIELNMTEIKDRLKLGSLVSILVRPKVATTLRKNADIKLGIVVGTWSFPVSGTSGRVVHYGMDPYEFNARESASGYYIMCSDCEYIYSHWADANMGYVEEVA
jgi:hypothetical protein